MTDNRQPKGTPIGGQFAEGRKAAPAGSVTLTDGAPSAEERITRLTGMGPADFEETVKARLEAMDIQLRAARRNAGKAHRVAFASWVAISHPDVAEVELGYDEEEGQMAVEALYDADGQEIDGSVVSSYRFHPSPAVSPINLTKHDQIATQLYMHNGHLDEWEGVVQEAHGWSETSEPHQPVRISIDDTIRFNR